MKKYTETLPKGMLSFAGKTLIERQIETYKKCGIDQIIIVRGFSKDKINYPGISYFDNEDYANTNMVASLFSAEDELNDDIIISYSDILFQKSLLTDMMKAKDDITVAVDLNWEKYWTMRYDQSDFDTESLVLGENNTISSLGVEDPPASEIDARYIGLIKLSARGCEIIKSIWHSHKDLYWEKPWQVSGKPLKKAYLTDMLQAVIDSGNQVNYHASNNGWLEFDTNEDYEKAIEWYENEKLKEIIKL